MECRWSLQATPVPSSASATTHVHSSALWRYDQLVPRPIAERREPADSLEDLVLAGVAAAVLAPEPELLRWFSWRWYARPDLVQRLVNSGRVARVDGGFAVPPARRGPLRAGQRGGHSVS